MILLKEYIRSIINELRINKNFIQRLRAKIKPIDLDLDDPNGLLTNKITRYNSITSFAARGRRLANEWINNKQLDSVDELLITDKNQIIKYAAINYARIFHLCKDDGEIADAKMLQILDKKFSQLLNKNEKK